MAGRHLAELRAERDLGCVVEVLPAEGIVEICSGDSGADRSAPSINAPVYPDNGLIVSPDEDNSVGDSSDEDSSVVDIAILPSKVAAHIGDSTLTRFAPGLTGLNRRDVNGVRRSRNRSGVAGRRSCPQPKSPLPAAHWLCAGVSVRIWLLPS
jgi:hypothetical protein